MMGQGSRDVWPMLVLLLFRLLFCFGGVQAGVPIPNVDFDTAAATEEDLCRGSPISP